MRRKLNLEIELELKLNSYVVQTDNLDTYNNSDKKELRNNAL